MDTLKRADELAAAAKEFIWMLRGDSSFQMSALTLPSFYRLQDALVKYEHARAVEGQ